MSILVLYTYRANLGFIFDDIIFVWKSVHDNDLALTLSWAEILHLNILSGIPYTAHGAKISPPLFFILFLCLF